MVLAAGLGTRLAPISDEIPKPIVPIGNRPLLSIIVEHLIALGISPLAINTHYRADEVAAVCRQVSPEVFISHEKELLGTAGGARLVARSLKLTSLTLVNGDIFGPLPVARLQRKGGEGLTLAVVPKPVGEGTVGIGASGEVVRLRGRIFGREVSSGDYMGVCQLGEACIRSLPEQGCLIGDYALPRLAAGEVIKTLGVEARFIDVGTREAYFNANMEEVERRGGSIIAAGALLGADVAVHRSVIGAEATIRGVGTIEECVLLPGARVVAPQRRIIATRGGQVLPV